MAGLVTAKFTYVEPNGLPAVTNVVPSGGTGSGGTRVTISGNGLAATRKIEFAGRPAFFEIHSDVTMTVTSPAGRDGADITITSAAGPSAATALSRFTYANPTDTPVFRVMENALVSADPASYAADVNGDGTARNQFGKILNFLNLQAQSDSAFADHSVDYIFRLDLMSDNVNAVLLEVGAPAATFSGTSTNGVFVSSDPLSTRQPITIVLPLATLGLGKVGGVRIMGCRVILDLTKNLGQLNGVITLDQIDTVVFPALARFYTDRLNAGTANDALIQLLHPSKDAQGKWSVTAAGVEASPTFAAMMIPDVQIFDLSGNYAPRTGGIINDAISFGLGFHLTEGPW
jgi:hypothetical protein